MSKSNGSLDWNTIKTKGIQFAFIKSTEGYADASWPESSAYDSRFEENMQNAINTGMIVGIYHFARPDYNQGTDEAKKEAQYFINKIKYYYQNNKLLPPVIDLEVGGSQYSTQDLTNWVLTFGNAIKNELGVEPILYLNESYANSEIYLSQITYKLWIAKPLYNESTGIVINTLEDIQRYESYFKPSINNWTFWQYSFTGTNINGKNMDRDVFSGTLSQLKDLTKQAVISIKRSIKKTGQTLSYTTYDDGYYQKGVTPSYTRDHIKEVVTDNITKLMWQDNAIVTSHSFDWQGSIEYCQSLTHGGYDDWRLPSVNELRGIVDYGKVPPVMNDAFGHRLSTSYWSSTAQVGVDGYAWTVSFGYGDIASQINYLGNPVRCVRAGE